MDAISINRSISGSSCPILGEPSVSRVVMFVVDESCERELFFSYSIVCMLPCTVLRQVIQSKRPLEYDIRLKPLTDTAADSYG
jgi:hypothetical protein